MSQPDASPSAASDSRRRFRWRRLLQYRLRTLLIFTTVVAIWLGLWSNSARRQRDAVAALRKAGATVEYDFERSRNGKPRSWPAWLVGIVGVDSLANVTFVSGWGFFLTDADLVHIRKLTDVQMLNLGNTQVTDAGLVNVKGLTDLESLSLDSAQITDTGLIQLQNLTKLRFLRLRNTKITDAGLVHLRSLIALQWLDLGDTKVTDAGVAQLQRSLPNCRILLASRTLRW